MYKFEVVGNKKRVKINNEYNLNDKYYTHVRIGKKRTGNKKKTFPIPTSTSWKTGGVLCS